MCVAKPRNGQEEGSTGRLLAPHLELVVLSCLLLLAQLGLQLTQLGLEALDLLLAFTSLGLESLRGGLKQTVITQTHWPALAAESPLQSP